MLVAVAPGAERFAHVEFTLSGQDDWLSKYTDDPAGLRGFCARHGIESHLRIAVDLVRQSFPSLQGVRVYLDTDPEEEGEWILIEVTSGEEVGRFLSEYNQCARRLIGALPPQALQFIRLSYSLM